MLKKIIKNLETGNYRVEYREHCDCRFNWHLENGELDCVITSTDGDCWFDNILIMDDLGGKRIATYDAYFGLTVQITDDEQEIINAIKDSDAYQKLTDGINSPGANNDLHDRRKREALAKWLSENDHLQTYVYYPRDFANEYVCVLLVLPHYYLKADHLQIPAHWYPKNAKEWAEMFLQKDTDGTKYDIGFELVNQIYETDYRYYNPHTDMTTSYGGIKNFFVDLQPAEADLKARRPKGINCYELNKLTLDYDGTIMKANCIAINWGSEAAKEARKNGNRFAPEPEPEKEPEPKVTPEMVFERYSKKYGIYIWQGIELTLVQDPFLREDDFGYHYYYAAAIDRKGNGWSVKWEILPHIVIDTHTDAGDHCDWANPVFAKMDEEEFYLYL